MTEPLFTPTKAFWEKRLKEQWLYMDKIVASGISGDRSIDRTNEILQSTNTVMNNIEKEIVKYE